MKLPDRETVRRITWLADGLLSDGGRMLPAGLMAALEETIAMIGFHDFELADLLWITGIA